MERLWLPPLQGTRCSISSRLTVDFQSSNASFPNSTTRLKPLPLFRFNKSLHGWQKLQADANGSWRVFGTPRQQYSWKSSTIAVCYESGIDLFAPVPERKGAKGRATNSGQPQIPADEFSWEPSSGSLSCPASHSMHRVVRSKDPRADNRHVIELRFQQDKSKCAGCELAARCLASDSSFRTVRRLADQPLIDAQRRKMESEAGAASNRRRKMRVERRYGDSKKRRGGSQLHGAGPIACNRRDGADGCGSKLFGPILTRNSSKTPGRVSGTLSLAPGSVDPSWHSEPRS